MATAITIAFEHWQAQRTVAGLPARADTVIFANVPGLNSDAEIDRNKGLPAKSQIVYTGKITQCGVINQNAVAYSIVLDTAIGDFDFNYLALTDAASGTVCMVVHTLSQKKIKTMGGRQGNSVTRTFMMEFNGAAEASQINIKAETWQIDYSARLRGIDESIRLSNLDYYGETAILTGLNVSKSGNQYKVAKGIGYVSGLRVELTQDITVSASPNQSIFIDVSLQGTVTGEWLPLVNIVAANVLQNYIDGAGFHHYIAKLASINSNSSVETVIYKTRLDLVDEYAKNHKHPWSQIIEIPKASITNNGIVKLNDTINSMSTAEAATPSAVKQAYDLAIGKADKNHSHSNYALKTDIPTTAADIKAIPETQLVNLAVVSSRTKIDDLDIINLMTGIYSYGNGAINSPNNGSAGQLIQLHPYRNEWIFQLWSEAYTSNIYLRSKKSEKENIFNPWVKLLTELDLQQYQITDKYGWLKLGNLLIQWGINTTASALSEWSFPISYPSRCCIVLVNACQPGFSPAAESASWNSQITTNSKFGVVSYQGVGGASVGNVSWFSIGY